MAVNRSGFKICFNIYTKLNNHSIKPYQILFTGFLIINAEFTATPPVREEKTSSLSYLNCVSTTYQQA